MEQLNPIFKKQQMLQMKTLIEIYKWCLNVLMKKEINLNKKEKNLLTN